MATEPFPAAGFIKEIGRGAKGARAIGRDDARALFAAMLEGRVSDLELGALLMALRIKGESVEELAGFFDAAHASFARLLPPPGPFAPVLIPSYNGARKLPNLTPLLACLLAREGVPVLVHGLAASPGRVTTAEIMEFMQLPAALDAAGLTGPFARRLPVFMPVDALAPRLAALLALRERLGVRNSAHTLVKILQPFDAPALRLVPYTHPEYLDTLGALLALPEQAALGGAFLMRGTEGEAAANAGRAQQIDWLHGGARTVLAERDPPAGQVPALPDKGAETTAAWIGAVLRGETTIPPPLAAQAAHCLAAARAARAGTIED